jgi:hypothetical protein
MFILDVSNPLTLILIVIGTALLIFLAQEVKKSYIAAIPLFVFLCLLVIHVIQMLTVSEEFRYLVTTISRCIALDFILIFITFFGYLWVDDIEAKATNRKSIDNSLDWFWKKI